MKSWAEIGFEIEITGDQSPSLRLLKSEDPSKNRGEAMHHSGGACAETILIYGEPIKKILQDIAIPSFIVVGLGLGYIEMTIAREALLQNKDPLEIKKITSYESVPELKEFFISWLWDQTHHLHDEVKEVYDRVASSLCAETALHPLQIKNFLRPHFPSVESIEGALGAESSVSQKYHGIMYDAFSSKTSPHLWDELFLNQFLSQTAATSCMVSTYACKATLKRALRDNQFEVLVREGFQGKRNSTVGMRGFTF